MSGKGTRLKPAAAPATVSGKLVADNATEVKLGKAGDKRLSRKPGNLPDAVVLVSAGVCAGKAGNRRGD